MSQLKALLFDVDGTLADTERDGHRVAFNKAFADAALDWHWSVDLYGELLKVTGGKERMLHYMDQYLDTAPENFDSDTAIPELHKAKTRHYLSMLEAGDIPLRPGVERLLKEARAAGLRLAIATTTTPENVTYLLKSTLGEQSIDWFEVIAAGDIVPNKKPAPDIYNYALEKMQLDPSQSVAFEDSELGLQSANAAGIKSVLITANGYTTSHDFSTATTVIDHLGDTNQPLHYLDGIEPAGDMIDLNDIRAIHRA